jgi:hypothetical protein
MTAADKNNAFATLKACFSTFVTIQAWLSEKMDRSTISIHQI